MPVYGMDDLDPAPETEFYSSGAAVAKMILDYIGAGMEAYLNPSQSDIYDYAVKPPLTPDSNFNADQMDMALGHFDPYDENVVHEAYYDNFDDEIDGNPYQGYNYTVDTFDNVTDYMKDIVHWMSYNVTEEAWWITPRVPVAAVNTPAALPIYGDTEGYSHWVALNGYAASADPTPPPEDPWEMQSFTVYGFWLTDPDINGIGQHVYVTAKEAGDHYFKPLNTEDDYDGKYLQVAEPPPRMPTEMMMTASAEEGAAMAGPAVEEAEMEIAEPKADLENLEIIQEQIEKVEAEKQTREKSDDQENTDTMPVAAN